MEKYHIQCIYNVSTLHCIGCQGKDVIVYAGACDCDFFLGNLTLRAVIYGAKFCKLPQPVITLEIMAARQNSRQESIGAGFAKNCGVLHNNHGRQWETPSLILCLHWAACANACGTNQGWWPFCFSVVQIYLVLMQESGLIFT